MGGSVSRCGRPIGVVRAPRPFNVGVYTRSKAALPQGVVHLPLLFEVQQNPAPEEDCGDWMHQLSLRNTASFGTGHVCGLR